MWTVPLTYKLHIPPRNIIQDKPNFSLFLAFTPSLLWYLQSPSPSVNRFRKHISKVQATFSLIPSFRITLVVENLQVRTLYHASFYSKRHFFPRSCWSGRFCTSRKKDLRYRHS